MNLRPVDLFLNPIPFCELCGYPMLPINNLTCWYSYHQTLEDFNPFRVNWHEDLDRTAKFQERFAPQILEAGNKALEEHPGLVESIVETRLESWVEEHGPNAGKLERDYKMMCERLERRKRHGGRVVPESQVSLISYIVSGSRGPLK